jgi:hypothetical protein
MEIADKVELFDYLIKPLLIIGVGLLLILIERRRFSSQKIEGQN